ncbi:MAG: hypothetical protein PXY39_08750 [archaeon]|nr:hypothetical protein [archaeon]
MALFGLSFVAGAPFLFSSSLPSSNATSAGQLQISVAPSLLLANPSFNAIMTVQILNVNSGTPIDASSPVEVILTSNNTAVATVPTIVYIHAGMSYNSTEITAGGSVGSALIKASAQGYLPAAFTVSAESTPTSLSGFTSALAPYFAPRAILSDNRTYPKMVVGELQATAPNGTVYPEVAATSVTVWARSSDNSTMQVSTVPYTIPVGQVYSLFNLTSSYFPGFANITMQANGLNPVTTGFTSYAIGGTSNPSTPTFFVLNTVTPSRILPGQQFNVQVYAQTENAPISSDGANLTWSAQGANLTSSESKNLNFTGFGSATLIASKQSGLENVTVLIKEGGITPYLDNITVNVYLSNMSLAVINPHPSIVTDYSTTFTIRAVSNNTGVANANLTWLVNNGTLINPPLTTNATGYALATYESGPKAGNFTVEAQVSKPGYSNATKDVNFLVVQKVTTQVQQPGRTNILYTKIGNILPLWALIPIIAAGAGGGFFVIRRYRNSGEGYYNDDDDEE